MTRKTHALLIALIFAVTLMAGNLFQVNADTKEDRDLNEININYKGYAKDRRGPVPFPHLYHAKEYGIACWDCHHDIKDGENIWVPWGETNPCITCHPAQTKKPEDISLQRAFHYGCKRCHLKMAGEGTFTEDPRKCSSCHVNE